MAPSCGMGGLGAMASVGAFSFPVLNLYGDSFNILCIYISTGTRILPQPLAGSHRTSQQSKRAPGVG